ncbi:peptidoglycan-binding protein [Anaerofustis sp. HA2171]|uniref:peptidoglycan-binding protein n=1 Tax=Anaerofustis butyriciformans TaxID=3108533 RepID=UPI002E3117D7|nr:peptidoglycan-binding protein [Anaerofustis sp. HA2171]
MLSIKNYQSNLKYYYGFYTGEIDGKNGPKTKSGVESYQKFKGLKVDGIYGPDTDKALVNDVKELQQLLNKHGFNLAVDGIIGNATVSAIKSFQKKKGLSQDGIAGSNTIKALKNTSSSSSSSSKVNWNKVKYFKKSEFKCRCGGKYCNGYPAEMSSKLINILEALREYFGKPITITSGLRCSKHNAAVGGVSNSQHQYGKAADIYIAGVDKSKIKAKAYELGAAYSYYGTAGMGEAVHINV